MPPFSLIVPAYGVERYLPACLQSIAAQTFADFEAIVVDDGSPDRSGAIADEFAAKDARFRVIHKQNAGVSTARNTGLAQAKGDWVWFIDGDDLIAPDALETLAPHLSERGELLLFDFVPFGAQTDASNVGAPMQALELAALRLKNIAAACPDDAPNVNVLSASFCLYRRAFLNENGVRFDEGVKKGEDALFNFCALAKAQTAPHVLAPLYWYRRNENSISTRYSARILPITIGTNDAYLAAIHALYGDAPAMLRRMNLRLYRSARVCLCLGMSSIDNPQPYAERKRAFLAMVNGARLQGALSALQSERLPLSDRVLISLLRRRRFLPLNAMYRAYTRLRRR